VPPLVLLVLFVLSAIITTGCADAVGGDSERPQNVLEPAGRMAEMSDRAWAILFPAAAIVLIVVVVALVYAMIRYRDRGDGTLPAQVSEHRYATAIWVIATVALLALVKIWTHVAAGEVVGYEADGDPLNVRVVAKQYWWEFEYTDREMRGIITANELHIPVGREVQLTMESLAAGIPDAGAGRNDGSVLDGVIHSFWVPRLSGKLDIIPGSVRQLVIEADEPGEYPGQCGEFCGLSHANMRLRVVAQEPAEFESWIEQQRQPVVMGREGLAAAGETLFERMACIECHAIRGYESEGLRADLRVGPDLTHFASRATFAGGIFAVDDDDALAEWLRDPPAMKPGAQMPDLGLSDREITALIAYLRTLE
jgi:cytochrome c oxidase subunit II